MLAIASELAGLEPGATSNSKKRIAMQFEDLVFREATSAADYQKRITKRLKKLKKNYRPPATANGEEDKKEREYHAILQTFGKDMEYVVLNATTAAREMRKHEKFKDTATYLESRAKLWTRELGIGQKKQSPTPTQATTPKKQSGATPPITIPSLKRLEVIKEDLTTRLVWLRSCVAKFVDPNEFILGSVKQMEADFKHKTAAVQLQSSVMHTFISPQHNIPTVETSLAQALRIVPPTAKTPDGAKAAAQVHLDKMRAASNVVLGYMMASDKCAISDPRALEKVHQEVMDTSLDPVLSAMKDYRKQEAATSSGIRLSDAWLKTLPLPPGESKGIQLRSKVLLTAGRKPPPSLPPALQEKGGRLVRPPPTGAGSHIVVEFAPAFTMTIFLVPLLVTIRAYQAEKTSTKPPAGTTTSPRPAATTTVQRPACASLPPLHVGLLDQQEQLCIGPNIAMGSYATIGEAIEDRLQDASTAATQVLRQSFARKAKVSSSTFETEVLEASALLEFVQLAKSTYGSSLVAAAGSTTGAATQKS